MFKYIEIKKLKELIQIKNLYYNYKKTNKIFNIKIISQ